MPEIKTFITRFHHTPDEPDGVPYVPPMPEEGKRREPIKWPERISERWIADGHGVVGVGRTVKGALRARRRAEAFHRSGATRG